MNDQLLLPLLELMRPKVIGTVQVRNGFGAVKCLGFSVLYVYLNESLILVSVGSGHSTSLEYCDPLLAQRAKRFVRLTVLELMMLMVAWAVHVVVNRAWGNRMAECVRRWRCTGRGSK